MITISHMVDSLCRKQAPKPEFQLRNALYALGTYAELAKFGPQQHLQRVMGRFLQGANSQTCGDHQKKTLHLAESGGRASGITLPLPRALGRDRLAGISVFEILVFWSKLREVPCISMKLQVTICSINYFRNILKPPLGLNVPSFEAPASKIFWRFWRLSSPPQTSA